MNARVLKREGSSYRQKDRDLVINWGSSFFPLRGLNSGESVAIAGNKLRAFEEIKEFNDNNENGEFVNIPEFWTNKEEIDEEDYPVVCRTTLNGHSGAGIVIANDRDSLVHAPLYVQYVKKKHEFRVHVVKDEVIAIQKKARNLAVDNPNWQVRNHGNGFVFLREFNLSDEHRASLEKISKLACKALMLDFGAVDVIYNERQNEFFVLEVNTAPGLQGQTIADYGEAFMRIAN
jgi:glutathione synthase/RimK-type ligase-like ATP-grasp enzyme